ncbi:MAG: 4Fe-4S binding protein [Pseudomonadota bacterium]
MAPPDRLIVCSCLKSQSLDADALQAATGAATVLTSDNLCQGDDQAERALKEPGTTMIACAQQAAQFEALADEIGVGTLLTADIRDRAGWSDGRPAHAKQAALLAAALHQRPPTPVMDLGPFASCLVIGDERAMAAAQTLAEEMAVTLLLAHAPQDATPTPAHEVAVGTIVAAKGTVGAFEVDVVAHRAPVLGGRGAQTFAPPESGVYVAADIILDLSGGTPLFPAPDKRDGYLRADPGRPAAVETAVRAAIALSANAFEKPIHIRFDAALCAHSRASQTGCTRCLNVCPTGAITSAGDAVAIDPNICAGCGACAAVCPSGAASLDDPPAHYLFTQLSTLAGAFRDAGGTNPRALFHDESFGGEMIALSARHGRGLPPDVIPIAVPNVEGVGHAELLCALAVGFQTATILASPRTDTMVVTRERDMAAAIAGADRLALVDAADPDALEDALYAPTAAPAPAEPILPLGDRRQVTRLAAKALGADPVTALPAGAPYGAVTVNTDACTLCLACVSLCPAGALSDNPDTPMLRFQETACLQCGVCESACPENAIGLTPQLDITNSAMEWQTLNEEEPFACIECGKLFGVRSTIERIVEKLSDKHWMFKESDNVRLIQMCEDCRVNAQYHNAGSPMRMGDRPRVRTTDDDLAARKLS